MLRIGFFMNSSCEEVLGFKTCCGQRTFDQNLEIHIENTGDKAIGVLSRLDLISPFGITRIDNLMPGGGQTVPPGEMKAFYCYLDEELWARSTGVYMYDTRGNRYEEIINSESQTL